MSNYKFAKDFLGFDQPEILVEALEHIIDQACDAALERAALKLELLSTHLSQSRAIAVAFCAEEVRGLKVNE
jgi:hypothetical protein